MREAAAVRLAGSAAGPVGLTHPHPKTEHGEADTVAEAGRGQEPCPGRRGGLAADVVHDELGRLPLALGSPRPLGPALLAQGAVEDHDQLQAALVQAGLRQGGQVAQHGVPLAPAHPVRLVAAVQPLQAGVRVDEDPGGRRRGRHGPWMVRVVVRVVVVMGGLAAHGAAELQEVHRDRGPGAPLLQVLLETLHAHDGVVEPVGLAGRRRLRVASVRRGGSVMWGETAASCAPLAS